MANETDFSRRVVAHRNRLTHLDTSSLIPIDPVDELIELVDTLGVLARVCVLREMRFPKEQIKSLVELYRNPPPPGASRPRTR